MALAFNNLIVPIWNLVGPVILLGIKAIQVAWEVLVAAMKLVWDYAIKPLWDFIGPPIIAGITAIRDNWDVVVSFMKEIWDATLGGALSLVFDGLLLAFEGIKMAWEGIVGAIEWTYNNILKPIFNAFKAIIEAVLVPIEKLVNAVKDVVGKAGSLVKKGLSKIGFQDGGIATGPMTGYDVTLHGTEAVVPLPNGRSIPVELNGGGGGGGNTFNITINAGGMTDRTDKREFARKISNAIQQEIARASGGSTMRSGR